MIGIVLRLLGLRTCRSCSKDVSIVSWEARVGTGSGTIPIHTSQRYCNSKGELVDVDCYRHCFYYNKR